MYKYKPSVGWPKKTSPGYPSCLDMDLTSFFGAALWYHLHLQQARKEKSTIYHWAPHVAFTRLPRGEPWNDERIPAVRFVELFTTKNVVSLASKRHPGAQTEFSPSSVQNSSAQWLRRREQFLTHCSFPTMDLVVRGMIQLNHIPHWSNFLTASVESLTKMGFPLLSANQIMYGTQTLPAEYFEK